MSDPIKAMQEEFERGLAAYMAEWEETLRSALGEPGGQQFATGSAAGSTWTRHEGPRGGTYWQKGERKVYQEEEPGEREGWGDAEFEPDDESRSEGAQKKRGALSSLVSSGVALAKAGHGVSKAKMAALQARVPASVRGPLGNVWHAVHAVLMASGTVCRAWAEEAGRARGLDDTQVKALGATLAAIDNKFQWGAMGVAMAAVTVSPPLALAAKAASYTPVASIGYLLQSSARDPVATAKGAFAALKKRFPAAIKGAAQFAWGAARHPLTSAHKHEETTVGTHFATAGSDGADRGKEAAALLAEHMAAAPDPERWLALFSVAFDEVENIEEAVRMADEVSRA